MLQQAFTFFLLFGAIQAWNPAAQLSGSVNNSKNYSAHTEITDFKADIPFQGFDYHQNGRLVVQECGLYHIYAQSFFEVYSVPLVHTNRVFLSVNGARFSYMQSGIDENNNYGSFSTAGVAQLNKGDYISLITYFDSKLWMAPWHTFFGAYKIGASANYCPPDDCVKS